MDALVGDFGSQGDNMTFEDSKEPVEFSDCEVIAVTAKALLVMVPPTRVECWIPVSQCDACSELTADSEVGDRGLLIIPTWLAEKKNLEF